MFFMMSAVIPSNFMTITAPWSPRWGKFGGAMEGADHGQALCTAELCNFCQFWWLCQFSWNFEYSKALKNADLWQNRKKKKAASSDEQPSHTSTCWVGRYRSTNIRHDSEFSHGHCRKNSLSISVSTMLHLRNITYYMLCSSMSSVDHTIKIYSNVKQIMIFTHWLTLQ